MASSPQDGTRLKINQMLSALVLGLSEKIKLKN
jgi:hypothetical protein